MATSGNYGFTISTLDILNQAYNATGLYGQGKTLSTFDTSNGKTKLNLMIYAWQQQGIHLWAVQEGTLFLVEGQETYSLGPTGDDCTLDYVSTTLSADSAASDTTLNLTSTTGMSASDNIGIILDDGTLFWTTIVGAPGSPTTIAAGLPSEASDGAVVFTYTPADTIQRPTRLIDGTIYRRDINNNDVPLSLISRTDYAMLSNKFSTGKSNQVFYEPTLTNGTLKVWVAPDSSSDVIRFSFERPFEGFISLADNPDFPIEWGEALIYNLAWRLAVVDAPTETLDRLSAYAAAALSAAMGFDKEVASVMFAPTTR